MADGYLEKQREQYEFRKAAWLNKKLHLPKHHKQLNRPEDEAL